MSACGHEPASAAARRPPPLPVGISKEVRRYCRDDDCDRSVQTAKKSNALHRQHKHADRSSPVRNPMAGGRRTAWPASPAPAGSNASLRWSCDWSGTCWIRSMHGTGFKRRPRSKAHSCEPHQRVCLGNLVQNAVLQGCRVSLLRGCVTQLAHALLPQPMQLCNRHNVPAWRRCSPAACRVILGSTSSCWSTA